MISVAVHSRGIGFQPVKIKHRLEAYATSWPRFYEKQDGNNFITVE